MRNTFSYRCPFPTSTVGTARLLATTWLLGILYKKCEAELSFPDSLKLSVFIGFRCFLAVTVIHMFIDLEQVSFNRKVSVFIRILYIFIRILYIFKCWMRGIPKYFPFTLWRSWRKTKTQQTNSETDWKKCTRECVLNKGLVYVRNTTNFCKTIGVFLIA